MSEYEVQGVIMFGYTGIIEADSPEQAKAIAEEGWVSQWVYFEEADERVNRCDSVVLFEDEDEDEE